jgi:hypothetical protein
VPSNSQFSSGDRTTRHAARTLLKSTTLADRNTRAAALRSALKTPEATDAAPNSRPTMVAEAVPTSV